MALPRVNPVRLPGVCATPHVYAVLLSPCLCRKRETPPAPKRKGLTTDKGLTALSFAPEPSTLGGNRVRTVRCSGQLSLMPPLPLG